MPDASIYQSGFGNHFESEAVAGALPIGRNSPQHVPFGLFAEQLSGTAFTTPRADNRRSWLYRLHPSANHPPYQPLPNGLVRSGPFNDVPPDPNRRRWDPLPMPAGKVDFVDGLTTFGGNGNPDSGAGVAIHLYAATASMIDRCFFDADGELLIVPQIGAIGLATEFGLIELAPGEIAVIPRGVRFRVDLLGDGARGYVCENYGASLRLPDLGPIGSNGLANARDFLSPVAAFENTNEPVELIQKYGGQLWSTTLPHSPLDVVAWHGNLAPCKYDLARFNTINTVSFDHPDPSIFTVLTSPSDTPGTANMDFVIFPPRWMVAEGTFRPPWFHRNVMSEYMGLIHGTYDAKAGGFTPGGGSLHNRMSGHGPDRASYDAGVAAVLKPRKIDDGLAFMFETRMPIRLSRFAAETPLAQLDYDEVWSGFAAPTLPSAR